MISCGEIEIRSRGRGKKGERGKWKLSFLVEFVLNASIEA
jgi:hypothetical protein